MTRRDDPQVEDASKPDTDVGTDTSRCRIDRGESLSWRVIREVAEAIDTDPRRMRPLYETIDPDALDRLFDPISAESREFETSHVTFRFEGCDVTAFADGRVVVSPPDDE